VNSDFPYDSVPSYALWKRSVLSVHAEELDPAAPVRFKISKDSRVASAGSCFARHIAVNLERYGFNYFCVEPGSEYSARFGNIYTTLQLLQLFDRAFGTFVSCEDAWSMGNRWVDPLRPRVVADGFATIDELQAARREHLAAVRRMFEELDVLVFTLGLTEGFISSADGTALPACPGKDFGEFDASRYAFRNLTVSENVEYLDQFLKLLRSVNSRAKVIFTVSPVPLVATMEDRSVIQSSVYSKSVLRVVADEMRRRHDFVDYFWSYEIVTSTFNTERYFESDKRNVNEIGVNHVMRSFFKHFAEEAVEVDAVVRDAFDPCDEEVLQALIKSALQ
jgi:hypothetical protein